MSDNKLVKTVIDAVTLTGLAAGIGWAARKVVKENFTSDPSSSVMNYAKFTAVMAGSIALKKYLEDHKSSPSAFEEKKNIIITQWRVLISPSKPSQRLRCCFLHSR